MSIPSKSVPTSFCIRVLFVCIFMMLAPGAIQGQVTLSLVRQTPLGSTFVDGDFLVLNTPLLARSGVFVHRGQFIDGAGTAQGIFVEASRVVRGENTEPVPTLGDIAPGTGGRFQFLNFPFANSNGQIAFYGSSNSSAASGNAFAGIFAGGPGALQPVALAGVAAPGTNGTFANGGFGINLIAFNDAGEAAFTAAIDGAPLDTNTGLWMGTPGAVQLVARKGNDAPGFEPGVTYTTTPTRVRLNASGQVAFVAGTSEIFSYPLGQGTTQTLWVGTPGALEVVARSGAPVPGTEPGTQFFDFDEKVGFNSSGQVAFLAAIFSVTRDPLLDGYAICLGTPDEVTLVAREDTQAAGVEAGTRWIAFTTPVLNASGELAFQALLEASDNSESYALYVGKPGQLRLVARTGTDAPGTSLGERFRNFGYFSSVALSDSGQVAFVAELDGFSGDKALFATDKTGVLRLIARVNTSLLGSPTIKIFDGLDTAIYPGGQTSGSPDPSQGGNGDGGRCSFDGAGHLIFKVEYVDAPSNSNRRGYYLATFDDSAPVIPAEGQPASVTGVLGGSATFKVTALGTRAGMNFQWKHNGQDLLNETSDTLILTNLTEADRGSYTVVITNAFSGTPVESAPALLSLPPVITGQSTGSTATAGADVSFSVTATGVGTLAYQWQFKGPSDAGFGDVNGAMSATLNLSNVTTAQAGRYRARVSNDDGTTTSAEMVLTVAPQGQPLIERIIYSDDPAVGIPGREFFDVGGQAVLNNSGDIAFLGQLQNADGTVIFGFDGLFGFQQGSLGFYTAADPFDIRLSDSGAAVMRTNLLSGNTLTNNGLLHGSVGMVEILAQEGSPAPGGGVFDIAVDPLINADGTAVFRSGAGTVRYFIGKPGALQSLVSTADQAPGLAAGINFAGLGSATLDDAGVVTFNASVEGTGIDATNNEGIWKASTATTQRIVAEGDQAPGAPTGVVFGTEDSGDAAFSLAEIAANEAGHIALLSELRGPGVNFNNDTALFAGAPGAMQLVAREGSSAAGRAFERFTGTASVGISSPLINSAGSVVFTAFVSGFKQSIWVRSPGGTPRLIAIQGQQAPGCPDGVTFDGYSAEYTAPYFNVLGINGAGQVAFTAFVAGTGISEGARNYRGIWMTTPSGQLKLIARSGDQFDIGGGTMKTLWDVGTAVTASGGEDGRARVLSEAGELVFTAVTDSGASTGIFRATLPNDGTGVPVVSTEPATSLTKTTATLNATVNPGGLATDVRFEYGTTASYGTTTPLQSLPAGTSGVPVNRAITGLTANTTYHFRVVATNAVGTTESADLTFTTPSNSPPTSGTMTLTTLDTITPGVALTVTFAGWIDAENDTPLSYLVQVDGTDQAAKGTEKTVTFNAPAAPGTYTLTGRIFDALDNFTVVSQQFEVLPPLAAITTTLVWEVGDDVPGAGVNGSGVPADAKWISFGVPSVNDAGDIAFLGNWTSPTGAGSGIFVNDTPLATSGAGATDGDGSPLLGATFANFKDPVLSSTGQVAFIATLKGTGVTKANATGLWRGAAGGLLRLVARAGIAATADPNANRIAGAPAETPAGATFATLLSFTADDVEVLFVGKLKPNRGGAKPATDLGIWSDADGVQTLRLREGQAIATPLGSKTVKNFTFLGPVPGSGGQPRALVASGTPGSALSAARVRFTDRSPLHALLRGDTADGFEVFAMTGQSADTHASTPVAQGMNWVSFGTPSWSSDATNFGFLATLKGPAVTRLNDVGIFVGDGNGESSLSLIEGTPAPGTVGAAFASFLDPVIGGPSSYVVQAKVAGKGTTNANASGLWWQDAGTLKLLARQGAIAPGTGGAIFKRFSAVAYAAPVGPIFVAQLQVPGRGRPNPGAVSTVSDIGLWAADSSGALRLLLREGQMIAGKAVKSFVAISSTAGSAGQLRAPGQPRGFSNATEIVCHVTFADAQRSTALVKIKAP